MKKKFLLIFVLITVCACSSSKDEEPQASTTNDGQIAKIAKEYGIAEDTIPYIESVISGIDTNQIYFNGRINKRLWISGFEKLSKERIFNWTEKAQLDTHLTVNMGFGEYKEFSFSNLLLRCLYKQNNNYTFILRSNNSVNDNFAFTYLYFINNNILIKKYQRFYYDNFGETFNEIIPWSKGIMITRGSTLQLESDYFFYDMQGDSLYQAKMIPDSDYEAVNNDEFIKKDIDQSEKSINFQRGNLKTGEILWNSSSTIIDASNEAIRIDNIDISKKDDIWTYTINYTMYSGTKKKVCLYVDISDGTVSRE
ncbi:MAG: hypothetical protein LKI53_09545 [Bacteroidales bacterium]|jgi:hypothetical protein|nr:hypothetical protein [Bacteroidales bacterium]